MTTIYEVSKLAGVSLATVSRVMNGTAKVSDKTQVRVKNAMEELGYVPNSVAISLASKRSNCVGVLVAELDGAFFGSMMKGIETELRSHRKHVVITAGHGELEQEKKGIDFLKSRNCDALIVHAEMLSNEYLVELSKGKTPIYVLNRNIPDLNGQCINLDNYNGGKIASQYVLNKGHSQIVNISGPLHKIDALERLNGFKSALEEKGLSIKEQCIYEGDYLQDSGADAIDYFLENKIPFTAVVCANDQMAIGAMARLREHGIRPAKDVAVIGFDDVTFAACTHPKLTTVNYPIGEMGKAAAKLVLKEVYKTKIKDISVNYEAKLIERDSVKNV